MNKLSPLDQVLYMLDANGMPVLMCGAMIVDPSSSPYPLDGKMIAGHLAARMEKIPLMRQKIAQDVLKIGNLRLIDDPEFEVNNHISLCRLKAPGGYQELTEHLGEFSAKRLDLNRPLWHYEVIEGLQGGLIAVAIHIHHCILDGIGAKEALSCVWDTKPVPAEQPNSEAWQVKPEPTPYELLLHALSENAERMYVKAPAFLMKSSSNFWSMLTKALSADPVEETEAPAGHSVKLPKIHKTSLNPGKLSDSRAVSYVEFPLAEVKALGRHFGCSVNDLMTLFNSYALQHYFEAIGEEIDFDLVAMMPVNNRESGDTSHGNKISFSRLSLHNKVEGAEKRLHAIMRDTAAIKKPKAKKPGLASSVDSEALMGLFNPLVLEGLVYSALKLRLMEKVSLTNVVVSNVPGYPIPIYIAGARQLSTVPMAPIADTVGLTTTIASTDSRITLGYHGCGEAIKDKELFVEGAHLAFEALKKTAKLETAASAKAEAAPPKKTAAPKPAKSTKPATKPAAKSVAKSAATPKPAAPAKSKAPAKKTRKPAAAKSETATAA